MRRVLVGICVVVLCLPLFAQETEIVVGERVIGGPPREAPQPTAEDRERGSKLLETAENQALALETPGMRAHALLHVGRAYQQIDKKKSLELLEQAMSSAAGVEDDRAGTRARLQQQILRAMVPLSPEKADELLPQLAAQEREPVLNALLGHYEKTKQFRRALDMVYAVAQEREMPYGAASRLMTMLPPRLAAEKTQLFTSALASYRNNVPHQERRMMVGGGFSGLVVRHAKDLPGGLVKEAITALLNEVDPSKSKDAQQPGQGISMASARGRAALGSLYEFRLFQLLPTLKQVDPDEAERLLKQHQQVAAMLQQYPEGPHSIMPGSVGEPGAGPGPRRRGGEGSGGAEGRPGAGPRPDPAGVTEGVMFSMGGPALGGPPPGRGPAAGPGSPGMMAPDPAEMQRVNQVIAEAATNPQQALTQATMIATPRWRAIALEGVARQTSRSQTSVARTAIERLMEVADRDLEPQEQGRHVHSAVQLYLQMEDVDSAKKAIERGLKVAAKLYQQDTNADDPNQALKAYWPSADAYRNLLRFAARISPEFAQEMLAGIDDEEIKTLGQIALAGSYLGLPFGESMIISSTKAGQNMSISVDRMEGSPPVPPE